jgi:hypothetical protein
MRDPETAAGDLLNLRAAADQVERPDHLGELEISITPARRLTREDVTAYAELGVHRIIVQPGRSVTTPEDLMAFVDANAPHNW